MLNILIPRQNCSVIVTKIVYKKRDSAEHPLATRWVIGMLGTQLKFFALHKTGVQYVEREFINVSS
jgi:hypothetical protein